MHLLEVTSTASSSSNAIPSTIPGTMKRMGLLANSWLNKGDVAH